MPHHFLEESFGLLWCTAQLVCTHFQCLLVCPQQRKGQRRISTCCQDDTQLGRKVLDQIRQGGVHLLLGDQLIVVQDQQKVICSLRQQVDKLCQDMLRVGIAAIATRINSEVKRSG